MWLGGLMGLTVVFAVTFGQPRIGASATIGILIAGQLVMGAVIDRFGLFGVPRSGSRRRGRSESRFWESARLCRSFGNEVNHRAKVWTALSTVYVIWGSTYLFIALAVKTLHPLFAASTRFLLAGTIMAGLVLLRGGTLRTSFRVDRLVRADRHPPARGERRPLLSPSGTCRSGWRL